MNRPTTRYRDKYPPQPPTPADLLVFVVGLAAIIAVCVVMYEAGIR